MKAHHGHRRYVSGSHAGNGKPRRLTEAQVTELREARASGATFGELQERFGVGRHTITVALQATDVKLSDFILRPS